MMMNNRRFYNFPRITVAVYFTEFENIIMYRGTRRARCLSEKAYNSTLLNSARDDRDVSTETCRPRRVDRERFAVRKRSS